MGCQHSADAKEGISKLPINDLERAPPSPTKISKVVISPEIKMVETHETTIIAKSLED